MYEKLFKGIAIILVILLLSSCTTTASEQDQARLALQHFLADLAEGNYEEAATQYVGNYETLISFNPDLSPDDHAALWQNGCEVNGLQCLTVRSTIFKGINEAGEYIFTVEFNGRDGILFELDACCGEASTTPPQSRFVYRVVEGEDGQYRVLDMPVYVP